MNPFKNIVIFTILLSNLNSCLGLEYNKQKYNPNTDFLAHEAGGSASVWSTKNGPISQNIQSAQVGQDYEAQFPALGIPNKNNPSSTISTSTTPKSQTGLRDYVAPQLPAQKQKSNQDHNVTPLPHQNNQPTGKRDYVAPRLPPQGQKTTQNSNQTPQPALAQTTNIISQPTGKRDYVSPQFTTLKPTQQNSGKVHDLINFYDGKNKNQNNPQGVPSFSSILQGNKQTTTPYSSPAQQSPQTTPKSFSSIVVGNNKVISTTTVTTARPTTRKPSGPGGPVLPSSIINNNRNNNKGNSDDNSPTDAEIQTLSEELLRKDTNNAAKYITINYQQKTTSQAKEDKAPLPLLTITSDAWSIPTVQKLIPLLDNYERDTMINEHVTAQERIEENAFMDTIMNTAVIRHLMTFLKQKGYVSPDPKEQRDFLKQLWFNLYSRGKGKISSSGFEHVFVSELKNGDVQGLHNWIYFSREETANRANYLGYLKYQPLGDKGAVLKLHFSQQGVDKPVDTMFIGTSPELEIALYTLCFVTRADNDCQLKLSSKDINIVTHTFRYRSKNYIGSAYPQI